MSAEHLPATTARQLVSHDAQGTINATLEGLTLGIEELCEEITKLEAQLAAVLVPERLKDEPGSGSAVLTEVREPSAMGAKLDEHARAIAGVTDRLRTLRGRIEL